MKADGNYFSQQRIRVLEVEYHSPNPDFTTYSVHGLGNYLTRLNLGCLFYECSSQKNLKIKCFKITCKVWAHCLTYSMLLIILFRSIWTSESLILPFLTPRPNCSSLTLTSWLPDLHLVLGHIELLTPRSSFPDSQITGLTQTLTAVWLSPDPLLAQPKPAAAHTTASQTLPGEGLTFFTETISIIWNFCQSGNCSAADFQGHSRIKQHIVS